MKKLSAKTIAAIAKLWGVKPRKRAARKAAKKSPTRKAVVRKPKHLRGGLYDDSPLSPRAKRSTSRSGGYGVRPGNGRSAEFLATLRRVDQEIRGLPRPGHFLDKKGGDGYSGYGRISIPGIKRYMGVGGDTWNNKNEAKAREIIKKAFGPSAGLIINID